MRMKILAFCAALAMLCLSSVSFAAYHHMGEADSPNFQADYPQTTGTKLDSCASCHSGGEYINHKGKLMKVGSCQWCHYVTDYGKNATAFPQTINPYGKDYLDNGRNQKALIDIEAIDSDGDTYTNIEEIDAGTFPGNAEDNPSLKRAPGKVFSQADLENMAQHSQVMLMNTDKSGDAYRQYTGVSMEVLLKAAKITPEAESITVFAPDGWSQTHPLNTEGTANEIYPADLAYPAANYEYNEQADTAISAVGWCDYTSPSLAGLTAGDPIVNDGGLKMILAIKSDGEYLTKGELDADNRLDGEGPYRVICPQVAPCPPDQASNSEFQDVIWPYNEDWDHNAGFSTRSVTLIRVNPLPEGTTDIDILEAGWNYIDEGKVLVYGAIEKDSDSSSGCSMNPDAGFSIEFIFIILAGIGMVIYRRKVR